MEGCPKNRGKRGEMGRKQWENKKIWERVRGEVKTARENTLAEGLKEKETGVANKPGGNLSS